MSLGLVDSHCHLTDAAYDGDRLAVIDRARGAGVGRMVAVGGGGPIEHSEAAADLAAAHGFIRATAGIHPHDARDYRDSIEARVMALLDRPEVVAVGETGLDYHYEHSERQVQKRVLARHLGIAAERVMPVVLHCRAAESDLRELLTAECPVTQTGVVHCFTGSYRDARWFLDRGLLISFTGIITFKNAHELRDVARRLPLDRLMVETDSPYLAPEPHRGRRNEPCHAVAVARMIAEIQGVSYDRVVEVTTDNALSLFFRSASEESQN
ncbi:MAG: TatD family hydrolase [Candidatus Binatia bacterium]